MITQKQLKELFEYNPETGIFIRKKRTAMRQKVGEVTNTENLRNMTKSKANTSGITGVSFLKTKKKWAAQICVDNQRMRRYFDTKKEAIKQRKEWNEIYGYHKNHGAEKND